MMEISVQNSNNQIEYLLPPQELNQQGKKTLVLDLDETLVHSVMEESDLAEYNFSLQTKDQNINIYVIERPGVKQFLHNMAPYYEIVIFTAGQKMYADNVINRLDPKNSLISHRLYRNNCIHNETEYIKDLQRLGRNLKDTIIIDNSYECFSLNPENGYLISSFFDDVNDCELYEITEFLIQMSEVIIILLNDVRDVETWKQKFDEIIYEKEENIIESLGEIDEVIETNHTPSQSQKFACRPKVINKGQGKIKSSEESTWKLLGSNQMLKQEDQEFSQVSSILEEPKLGQDFYEEKQQAFPRRKKHSNTLNYLNSKQKQAAYQYNENFPNLRSLKNIQDRCKHSTNNFRANYTITIEDIKLYHIKSKAKSSLNIEIQQIRFQQDERNVMSPLTKSQEYFTKTHIVTLK